MKVYKVQCGGAVYYVAVPEGLGFALGHAVSQAIAKADGPEVVDESGLVLVELTEPDLHAKKMLLEEVDHEGNALRLSLAELVKRLEKKKQFSPVVLGCSEW